MFRLMLNPTKGRFSTYLPAICFAVFCLEARADFVITLSAESDSSTTVTVRGGGAVTSNNDQYSFSDSGANNQFSNLGNFVKDSGPDNQSYNFSGALTLSGGGQVISFERIYIDDDGGSDDFGLGPASPTGPLSGNTVYTLGGSTTFTLTGGDTWADFNPGTYIPDHALNGGGWKNFDPDGGSAGGSWFSVVVPEPSTALLLCLGLLALATGRWNR